MKLYFDRLLPDALAVLYEDTGVSFYETSTDYAVCMVARDDAGRVMAVAVGERKSPHDIHLSVVVRNRRAITREVLRKLFSSLFYNATRVTMLVDPDNTEAIDRAQRLGAVYEGFLRLGLDGRRDAYIYGMLKGECSWIGGHHTPRQLPLPLSVARH